MTNSTNLALIAFFRLYRGQLHVICGFGAAQLHDHWVSSDGATWTASYEGLTNGKSNMYSWTFIRRVDDNSKLDAVANFIYDLWETFDGVTVPGPNELLLTGTVSLSTTALTGAGTAFDTELEAGDFIRIDGVATSYEITSVTNATNAVVVNADSDTYTTKSFSLMAAVGEAITTNVWNTGISESIEDLDERQIVTVDVAGQNAITAIYMPSNVAAAVAKGATHLRVFRTIGNESASTAAGLALRYLVDIALTGDTYAATRIVFDRLSDSALAGELHQLEVTGYEPAPPCRYIYYDTTSGLMWCGGDPDNPGYWYHTLTPLDSANPQKYHSWYDLDSLFSRIDPHDGQ